MTYPGTNNFTELTYDGLGQLVKIVETNSGSVTSTKQLIWCGNRICEERDNSGAVTAKFLAFGEKVGSTDYFYEKDHLGSIVGVVNSSGVEVTSIRYDAWGKPTISGSYTPNFGFAGMYLHQRSGLNLTLFRAYSGNFERWLSRDPIGEDAGTNLYAYTRNNPISLVDPLGLREINGSSLDLLSAYHIYLTEGAYGPTTVNVPVTSTGWGNKTFDPSIFPAINKFIQENKGKWACKKFDVSSPVTAKRGSPSYWSTGDFTLSFRGTVSLDEFGGVTIQGDLSGSDFYDFDWGNRKPWSSEAITRAGSIVGNVVEPFTSQGYDVNFTPQEIFYYRK